MPLGLSLSLCHCDCHILIATVAGISISVHPGVAQALSHGREALPVPLLRQAFRAESNVTGARTHAYGREAVSLHLFIYLFQLAKRRGDREEFFKCDGK